jgi:hypothetical protein
MKRLSIFAALLPLTACVTATPIVAEFNGSSVTLAGPDFAYVDDATKANFLAEANRICGKVGKRAEYASSMDLPYQVNHLYLCL